MGGFFYEMKNGSVVDEHRIHQDPGVEAEILCHYG